MRIPGAAYLRAFGARVRKEETKDDENLRRMRLEGRPSLKETLTGEGNHFAKTAYNDPGGAEVEGTDCTVFQAFPTRDE